MPSRIALADIEAALAIIKDARGFMFRASSERCAGTAML